MKLFTIFCLIDSRDERVSTCKISFVFVNKNEII